MPKIITPAPNAPMTISQFLFEEGGGVVVVGFTVISCVSARLCLKFRFSYSSGMFSPPH